MEKYKICKRCDFNVSSKEKTCRNCGTISLQFKFYYLLIGLIAISLGTYFFSPFLKNSKNEYSSDFITTLMIPSAIVAFFLIKKFYFSQNRNIELEWFGKIYQFGILLAVFFMVTFALLFALLVTVMLLAPSSVMEVHQNYIEGFVLSISIYCVVCVVIKTYLEFLGKRSSLKQKHTKIQKRLEEIESKIAQVKKLYQHETLPESSIESLNVGHDLLCDQYNTFLSKEWEVWMIRWHNKLKPYTTNWRSINPKEYAQCETLLHESVAQGRVQLDSMKESYNIDKNRTLEEVIKNLEEAIETTKLMEEDIITKQASSVIEDLSFISANRSAEESNQKFQEQIDYLNALGDVGMFSAGLDELDKQLTRLSVEKDLSQHL